MNGIRYTLTFLWGCLFASCVWCIVEFPYATNNWVLLPMWFVVVCGLMFSILIIRWLLEHWDDKENRNV